MNNIAQTLREFIKENFLYGQDTAFADEDSFLELGIIDSTGVLELIMFVEEAFKIAIEDDDLVPENLDSINGLVRFIGAKQQTSPVES